MDKQISRRTLAKTAAGAGAGMAAAGSLGLASKRSSVYSAPAVIQSGPVEVSFWHAFPSDANAKRRPP